MTNAKKISEKWGGEVTVLLDDLRTPDAALGISLAFDALIFGISPTP
jgi:hypothetical protein